MPFLLSDLVTNQSSGELDSNRSQQTDWNSSSVTSLLNRPFRLKNGYVTVGSSHGRIFINGIYTAVYMTRLPLPHNQTMNFHAPNRSAKMAPPTLLNLANELLLSIADLLPYPDTFQFRTTRHLNAQLSRPTRAQLLRLETTPWSLAHAALACCHCLRLRPPHRFCVESGPCPPVEPARRPLTQPRRRAHHRRRGVGGACVSAAGWGSCDGDF
jgi:hypothetical protein